MVSGEVTITPSAVEVNSTRDYTIAYKAATAVENVYLVVRLPEAAFGGPTVAHDGAFDRITRSNRKSRTGTDGTLNYGYIPDADDQILATDGAFIIWKIAKLGKGSTLQEEYKKATCLRQCWRT